MTVNGIIAEYNPFHNGHLHQLRESLRLTGADYTIVVMSGNFVQRGAPALSHMHLRAEAALRCGADLVIELPVLYAAASAEYFAAGAVALLDKLGVVTHLCFGSECGSAAALNRLACTLAEEPAQYRSTLRQLLKEGVPYPDARCRALGSLLPSDLPENWETLLSSPNNLLGMEYLRALLKRSSPIVPITVKRLGAGYHETAYGTAPGSPDALWACGDSAAASEGNAPLCLCSALAIRQALEKGEDMTALASCMPPESASLLLAQLEKRPFLHKDAFSSILYYKLLTERKSGYEKYLDVSPDLSERIKKQLGGFTGFEAFCQLIKTKNMAYARISRCLLHILLDIEKEHMALGKSLDYSPYARVLGFRKDAQPLLAAVKKHSSIPLITKLTHGQRSLPEDAGRLLELDIRAAEIYNGVFWGGTGLPAPSEFSTPLVLL